mmetsp:Transcript_11008/g.15144  ORF Transcript_11008/g.15144 Transcript_11008/m.15144 type:complete len:432 (-) Transcript_11008:28-1323(-)
MCFQSRKSTVFMSLLLMFSGHSYNWRPKCINSLARSSNIQYRNSYWQRSRLKTDWHPYSSVNTLLSLQRGSLSLDRTMIPKSPSLLNKIIDNMSGLQGFILYAFSAMVATLLLQLLSSLFRSLLSGSSNNDQSTSTSFMESISNLFSSAALSFRNIFSTSSSDEVVKEKALDLNQWNVCKVADRQSLNSEYSKYTMELPSSMSSTIKLALGQELQLCVVDARNRVLKEECFPVACGPGSFEIVVRNPPSVAGTRSRHAKFSAALQQLLPEDELAVKAGRRRLTYRGPETAIENIAMVVSGLGIAPALQLLRQLLPPAEGEPALQEESQPAADTAFELLWINEKKTDFILNEQLEQLEARHPEQLYVARVIDSAFGDAEAAINDKLRSAIAPYEAGRLALVLASPDAAGKASSFLEGLGYAEESVFTLLSDE